MEERKLTFDDVCEYAEKLGCEHRNETSRAKNYAGEFFYDPWRQTTVMVLYEAPRRIVKGHTDPEVCWWVLTSDGDVYNMPSRLLRKCTPAKGLSIWTTGYDKIKKKLNGIEDEEIVL